MKTIQEMAREAGGMFTELPMMDAWVFDAHDKSLEAFAKLVAAAEREECALIAWNYEPDEDGPIEIAIRARSNA